VRTGIVATGHEDRPVLRKGSQRLRGILTSHAGRVFRRSDDNKIVEHHLCPAHTVAAVHETIESSRTVADNNIDKAAVCSRECLRGGP